MLVLKFIKNYFDFNVTLLFLISVFFLYFDSKEYKTKGMQREYKFCRFFMYLYILVAIIGFTLFLNLQV